MGTAITYGISGQQSTVRKEEEIKKELDKALSFDRDFYNDYDDDEIIPI